MFCLSFQQHHRPQCQYRCHRAAPSRQPLTSCAPEAIRSCCPRFRWMLWPDPLLLSMSPGPLRSSPLTLIWASAAGTSLTPVELDFVWVWGGRGGQGSERGKGGCREMWERERERREEWWERCLCGVPDHHTFRLWMRKREGIIWWETLICAFALDNDAERYGNTY